MRNETLLTISISRTRSEPRAADKTEDVGSARFLNQMIVDKVALRVYYVLGYSEGGVCRNEDRSTHWEKQEHKKKKGWVRTTNSTRKETGLIGGARPSTKEEQAILADSWHDWPPMNSTKKVAVINSTMRGQRRRSAALMLHSVRTE